MCHTPIIWTIQQLVRGSLWQKEFSNLNFLIYLVRFCRAVLCHQRPSNSAHNFYGYSFQVQPMGKGCKLHWPQDHVSARVWWCVRAGFNKQWSVTHTRCLGLELASLRSWFSVRRGRRAHSGFGVSCCPKWRSSKYFGNFFGNFTSEGRRELKIEGWTGSEYRVETFCCGKGRAECKSNAQLMSLPSAMVVSCG